MRRTRLGCAVAAMWAVAVAARAELPVRAEVDRIAQPYVAARIVHGLTVALIDAEGRAVFGYGQVGDSGRTPDGRTVYEIGSVTKTCTGLLLAQMAVAGEVKLDDPVGKYLPAEAKMPQRDGVAITLAMLSTHRSGLPRLPNLRDPRSANPYADFTVAQLYEFLSACKLPRKPGEAYEYSNLGGGLLGHALSLRAGKSYEDLVIERICRPLGMDNTRITLDEGMRSRLAQGYGVALRPLGNWDMPTLAGAGALRSTTDDLLRYVSAELGLTRSVLDEAIRLSQVRQADAPGGGIALGWLIGQRTGALMHSGQTGGYHSFVAFVPEKKVGVVVLCDTATDQVDRIGTDLLRIMLGEKVPTPRPATNPAAP